MKYIFSTIIFLFLSQISLAQLKGKITDSNGEPLPFASVYVQGTSNGTTSNGEGNYDLFLKKGTYKVVFQYVGFKQRIETVTIDNESVTLNVELQSESIGLEEIVVRADAEDPAYPIIRKAMKKRKYYKEQVEKFQCNVYIKGGIKLLDAPTKMLGVEVGDMGGQLDSSRQGIVYLSESEAILNFQQPDEYKEIMISSKVSGDDNGFSFNRASSMDFDLYDNTSEFQREIISPIANNAFTYYKYKLLGKLFDKNGNIVNKIEVIQKRKEDPSYGGIIYIMDDLWNIQSSDLYLTSKAVKFSGLDTIWVRQVHVPLEEPDVWRLFSQTISFKANVFGFKLVGDFTGIFKDYNLNPTFEKKYFDNEILIFEEGANEKNLEYWDSIRPIPLTVEEDKDYIKKDSLQEIWDSKPYKDSIDRVNNKFGFVDLLFGYSYRNSWKRESFRIKAPLSTVQFNPVQGGIISLDMNYQKGLDDRYLRYYIFNPKVQYSFGDDKLRARLTYFQQFNGTRYSRLFVAGGREVMHFNSQVPIKPLISAAYNLLAKENFMKLYERDFGYIYYRQEIINGLRFGLSSEFAKRRPLEVNTNYSWKKKDEIYEPNIPQIAEIQDFTFEEHNIFNFTASFQIRFAQKYLTYPDRKFIIGSKYPTFRVEYQKAIPLNENFSGFDKVTLRIYDSEMSMGVFGDSEFNIKAGTFFNKKRITPVDYQHFLGNETFITNPFVYQSSFLQLPYYEMSTASSFFEGHYQHHFNGFLLDKIPNRKGLHRDLFWN